MSSPQPYVIPKNKDVRRKIDRLYTRRPKNHIYDGFRHFTTAWPHLCMCLNICCQGDAGCYCLFCPCQKGVVYHGMSEEEKQAHVPQIHDSPQPNDVHILDHEQE